jgi:25S rRNA (uracil2634-N3)-methyltransferase
MILGFLRSIADFLVRGPAPLVHSAKRKQKSTNDEEMEDTDEEGTATYEAEPCRGTVLLTLRNVPPYTTWYVLRGRF